MTQDQYGCDVGNRQVDSLSLGGFIPFSTDDWPGLHAAVLFLQGCPWMCTYCNSPDLQNPFTPASVPWERVYDILQDRVGLLDGVVFSGGEPTRQAGLLPAIHQVRKLGYRVGLHTAGAYPRRLAEVLPFVDWVALDVKATPQRYLAITGRGGSGERAWESLDILRRSETGFEVRVTVDPTTHTERDIDALLHELRMRGVEQPVLQEVIAEGTSAAYAQRLAGRTLADVLGTARIPARTTR